MSIDWELDLIDNQKGLENNSLSNGNFKQIIQDTLSGIEWGAVVSFDIALETKLKALVPSEAFTVAIAGLLAFIQQGWTGPSLEWTTHSLLAPNVDELKWTDFWLKQLTIDGEDPYSLTPEPFLLCVANTVFTKLENFPTFQV
jgi:hypothetical protein